MDFATHCFRNRAVCDPETRAFFGRDDTRGLVELE